MILKRHLLKVLTLLMLAVGLYSPASACSCVSVDSFIDVSENSALVIHGKVISHNNKLEDSLTTYSTMTIKVIDTLKGNTKYKEIELIGDQGTDCRPYITEKTFGLGREFLFSLYAADEQKQPLYNCGEYWLPVTNGVARGNYQHQSYLFESLGWQLSYKKTIEEIRKALEQ